MFIIVCCCFCCSGRGIVNTHRGICWNNIEVVRALGNVVCFSLSVRKLKYWIYHVCLRLSHVCLRRFKNRHVKTMIPYFYKQTTTTTTTTHHTTTTTQQNLIICTKSMYTPPTRYRYLSLSLYRYQWYWYLVPSIPRPEYTTHRPTKNKRLVST